MKCPKCNFDVPESNKFCPECGEKMPENNEEVSTPFYFAEKY